MLHGSIVNYCRDCRGHDRMVAGFVNYKKGALDSQPQVIKFTSCLPMVGGSLRYSGFLHH